MATAILIGGEKGGVGKSMITKAIVQYFIDHHLLFQAFDTDRSNPDIYRIYDKIQKCNLGIFGEGEKYEDTANEIFNCAVETTTIVNLPAQVFIPIKEWFEKNGILDIATEAGVIFSFWFVLDGGYDSLNLLRKNLEYFQDGVRHIIVKNYGKTDDWEAFDQDKSLQKLIKKHNGIVLNFPKFIGSVVRNRIDAESLPFSEALDYSEFSLIEKQRVRKFLREAYSAFEEAGVFKDAAKQ